MLREVSLRQLEATMKTSGAGRMTSRTVSKFEAFAFNAGAFLFLLAWSGTPAGAADEQTGPWECSGYAGEAHERCVKTFSELQQEKISRLEAELRRQQSSVNELRDQVERQRATTADLERQLSDRANADRFYAPPLTPFYSYSYSYPPVGLGLYFGSPWYYGPPYLYRPFGPSLYFGPRRFGHRYFGCRGRC
jgi:hypothetical protein